MQRLAPAEEEIFRRAQLRLDRWRKQGAIDETDLQQFYQSLEAVLRKEITE